MSSEHQTVESGNLPGRYEWVSEPDGPMSVPDDPEWKRFSDTIREFSASAGANVERQDAIGTPDATDHGRSTEEPEASISYDLQRFPVDGEGDPIDPSAYGILRTDCGQLLGTLLAVERTELCSGGNDDAGIRMYTVVRGATVETAEPTLDPSENNPILMELGLQPRKVRSYAIHQPAEPTTLELSSSDDSDTMEVTIESEDAEQSETISLDGETEVTTTEEFGDIDAIWLESEPKGDISVSGGGVAITEIYGGHTYSGDGQPVDGDQGVPTLGSGSHADPIGTSFEYFVGDRVERPVGSPLRPRINSASWSVENSLETDSLHTTRQPSVDVGDRTVQVEADVAGPKVSHDSMMEALTKDQNDIEHELSGGIVRFKNATLVDGGERQREASDQAVASISESFEASGDPAIELEATN